MAKVTGLRTWRNGETINARDYVYERNVITTAINTNDDILALKVDEANVIYVDTQLPADLTTLDPQTNLGIYNTRWFLIRETTGVGHLYYISNTTAIEVELKVGQVNLAITGIPEDALGEGEMRYNDTTGSFDFGLKGGHILSVGGVLVKRVRNDNGTDLKVGQVVYVSGAVGNSGLLKVKKASNVGESTSSKTFGIVATTMSNGQDGYVYLYGLLQGINLNDNTINDAASPLQQADVGGSVFLGEDGKLRKGIPTGDTQHSVFVGYLETWGGNGNNASIYVKIQNGYEIDELHDVRISNKQDGEVLVYDSTRSIWKNSNRLSTAESDIDTLQSDVNTAESDITSLEGRMTTAETDIDNVEQDLSTHENRQDNPHTVTKTQVGLSDVNNTSDLNKPISTATQTALDLKADLVEGKVPASQLPSYVDDVLEVYERAGTTPTNSDWFSLTSGGAALTPEIGKIYVVIAGTLINKTYRWGGTHYSIIGEMALGTTAATAFFGDRGLALETLTDNIVDGSQALALKDQVIRNTVVGTSPLVVNSIASTTANLTEFQFNGDKVLEVTPAGGLNQNGTRLFRQTGTDSTFFGQNSGNTTLTGINNTSFGVKNLFSLTTGSYNTSFGIDGLGFTTTGENNVSVGQNSGRTITTGSNNIFVGTNSGYTGAWGTQIATISNSTALGNQAVTDKSNQMVFGNASVTEFVFNRNANSVALFGGNVSIGTTSPNIFNYGREFTVSGSSKVTQQEGLINIQGTATANTTVGGLTFNNLVSGVNLPLSQIVSARSSANNSGTLGFQTSNAGSLTEKMTILPNGNVGIGTGTASPTTLLDVRGITRIGNGSSAEQYLNLVSANGNWQVGSNNDGNGTNGNQFYIVDSAYRFTIQKGTGNVGIGTTSPAERLHIVNNVLIGNGASASNFSLKFINNSSGGTRAITYRTDSSISLDNTAGNALLTSLNNGNVGIGTPSPGSTFSVSRTATNFSNAVVVDNTSGASGSIADIRFTNATAATGFRIGKHASGFSNPNLSFIINETAGDLDIGTNDLVRLKILSSGLVGINETSPTAQLQVKSGATTRVPLIVNTIADHTASLQQWLLNGTINASVSSDGRFTTRQGISNFSDSNNSRIDTASTGVVIQRNVADTNPALITNLANASATGNIQVWQKAGTAKAWITNDGGAKFEGSITFNGSSKSLADDINLNTVVLSGFYRINNGVTNGPTELASYSQLIVSRGSDTILQIIGNYGNTNVYTRTGYGIGGTAVFNPWVKLINSTNFLETARPASEEKTADYTLAVADEGKVLRINSSSNRTVTIPLNSGTAIPIGAEIAILRYGSGTVSISPTAGVTLQSADGERKIKNRYGSVALKKIGTDEWVLVGSLEA